MKYFLNSGQAWHPFQPSIFFFFPGILPIVISCLFPPPHFLFIYSSILSACSRCLFYTIYHSDHACHTFSGILHTFSYQLPFPFYIRWFVYFFMFALSTYHRSPLPDHHSLCFHCCCFSAVPSLSLLLLVPTAAATVVFLHVVFFSESSVWTPSLYIACLF